MSIIFLKEMLLCLLLVHGLPDRNWAELQFPTSNVLASAHRDIEQPTRATPEQGCTVPFTLCLMGCSTRTVMDATTDQELAMC